MKTKFGNAKINNVGYYKISSVKEGNRDKLLHRLIAVDYFGDWIDKPLINGEKIDIHHIDGDKTNNCVLNLLPLPRSEHRKLHNPEGENHKNYGKHHSEETKQKISESRNTTGYYRVSKTKTKKTKQGFVYRYWYSENGKRKAIERVDLEKLGLEVKARGLKWCKFENND